MMLCLLDVILSTREVLTMTLIFSRNAQKVILQLLTMEGVESPLLLYNKK